MAAIDSLDMLRDVHSIPEDMDEDEALEEIHRIATTPPPKPANEGDVEALNSQITELQLALVELYEGGVTNG